MLPMDRRIKLASWVARSLLLGLSLLAAGSSLADSGADAGSPAKQDSAHRQNSRAPEQWVKEIARRGNMIVVPESLANEVRKDATFVLSTVAIKGRLGKDGHIAAYELVQIDSGSIPEKMGFKPKDLISEVNGVPARDFIEKEKTLQSANRFNVTLLRNGKVRKLVVAIRQDKRN